MKVFQYEVQHYRKSYPGRKDIVKEREGLAAVKKPTGRSKKGGHLAAL